MHNVNDVAKGLFKSRISYLAKVRERILLAKSRIPYSARMRERIFLRKTLILKSINK